VAIMTPWKQFETIDPESLVRALVGDVVVDPFRVLNARSCTEAGLRHFTLGKGA
jgi:UDPglucose 6-dehydrogenase